MSPTFKTMEAKEKAEQLLLKFLKIDNNTKEWFNKYMAKQCALIVVDEIMQSIRYIDAQMDLGYVGYWQEVKQEINKL